MERFARLLQDRRTWIEQRITAALQPIGVGAGEGTGMQSPAIAVGEWISALEEALTPQKMPGTHDAAHRLGIREAERFFHRDLPASLFMNASEQTRRACLDLAADGGLSSSEDGVTSGIWAFFSRLKTSFFEESRRLWGEEPGAGMPFAVPGTTPHGKVAESAGSEFHLDTDLMNAALQAAANAVVITDGEGTIRWVNDAFTRLTRYSKEEVIGQNPRILKSGLQDNALYLDLWGTISKGKVWKGELVNRRKDGTLYTEEMTITPVRNGAGAVDHFIAIKEDISPRKATETALKANEEHYRLLVENQGEGIGIVDMEENFIFCNPAADVIFGVRSGGLLGQNLSKFIDSSQADIVRQQSAMRRKGEKATYELDIVLGNGERRNLLVTAVPRTDAEGKANGTFGVFRDISARKHAEEKVKFNANLLRNIIDSSPDFIFVKDNNLKTMLCNDIYAGALGKSPSDLCGRTDIENGWDPALVVGDPSKGIRGFECDDREALAGASIHNSNDPANVNGDIRIFDTIKLPLRDSKGEIFGVLGMSRDITERKRVEEALRDSEARYRALFQASTDGILIADIETKRFKYANPSLCQMLGYSEEEVIALSLADIHPKEDLPWISATFEAQARGEKPPTLDIPCLRKDDTLIYAEINAISIDITGRPHLVGLFHDISERKRAGDALRFSEEQFRAMFELASVGMAQADPNTGKWVRVNQKMCAITGYSPEEMLEMCIEDLTHPEDRQRDWETFQKVVRGTTTNYRMEKRYICKNGSTSWVNVNMTVLKDDAGRPTRTMATIEDINERKGNEEQIKRHLEELKRWQDVMLNREDRIQELKREVNELSRSRGGSLPYPSQEAVSDSVGSVS